MNDKSLITFKAIANFVNELGQVFSSKQHSLKLYSHLLNKTTLAHDKPIEKHIEAFKKFCVSNKEAITSKDETKFIVDTISYSDRCYINIKQIFQKSDKQTKNVIWKHLLIISALVDPQGKAREILKQKSSTKEGEFLSDILSKVEEYVDPNAHPMQAVASIMQSGVLNDLLGSMNSGLQDGSINLGSLLGSVQGLVSSMQESASDDEGIGEDNPMNMINNMMSTMMSSLNSGNNGNNGNNKSEDIPDLSSFMGSLMNNFNTNTNISSSSDNIKFIEDNKETDKEYQNEDKNNNVNTEYHKDDIDETSDNGAGIGNPNFNDN